MLAARRRAKTMATTAIGERFMAAFATFCEGKVNQINRSRTKKTGRRGLQNLLAFATALWWTRNLRKVPMKKIICLLLLLTLSPGVHAGDKKKKKGQSGGAPISAPSGGGGGGGRRGGGFSGLPGMGQSGGRSRAQRPSTRSVPRIERPGSGPWAQRESVDPEHGQKHQLRSQFESAHAQRRPGRREQQNLQSAHAQKGPEERREQGSASNPLTRKGGQAGAGGQNSNPLTRGNRSGRANAQAGNPMRQGGRQAGAKNGNPMAGKGAGKAGMGDRNRAALSNRNKAGVGRNRGAFRQNERGYRNRVGARNWQRSSHANYRVRSSREVFHNYRPIRHNRVWYTSRYDRVVVVGGGYYYWDAGYWYPAWGYDPAVSLYVYDGPIYSYDNLPPDQVTMNVQIALQDDGYYTGDVDGLVGPKTREALGTYQADHDLEVTSAIDEPTVESLGLAQS